MKRLLYPGTLEALNSEVRGLCAGATVLFSAVPACLRPALTEFLVGRGTSTTAAGELVIYARDLRLFWDAVYEQSGLPYGIKTIL